jgi:hypothetical protein
MNGYIKEKSTNNIVSYWDLPTKPEDTDELEFITCDKDSLPECYVPPKPLRYDSDALIKWAMDNVFVKDLIPHMASFLSFADKGTQAAADNFRKYASLVDLVGTVEIIITKAIELGAKIEEV